VHSCKASSAHHRVRSDCGVRDLRLGGNCADCRMPDHVRPQRQHAERHSGVQGIGWLDRGRRDGVHSCEASSTHHRVRSDCGVRDLRLGGNCADCRMPDCMRPQRQHAERRGGVQRIGWLDRGCRDGVHSCEASSAHHRVRSDCGVQWRLYACDLRLGGNCADCRMPDHLRPQRQHAERRSGVQRI